MSNPRKKRSLGPSIDIDELYTAPNLRGMLSFLEVSPDEARLRHEAKLSVDAANAKQTEGVLPFPANKEAETSHNKPRHVESSHLEDSHLKTVHQEASWADSSRLVIRGTAEIFSDLPSPFNELDSASKTDRHLDPRHLKSSHLEDSHPQNSSAQPSHIVSTEQGRRFPFRIREARLVQDGHTAAEQTVYDYMWRRAKPLSESLRVIRIGRKLISRDTGITETTAKAALQGLHEKLAIDREGTYDMAVGYEYKVYSWPACLTRRKQAGLTHIIKSKGVIFVDPETGQPITGTHYPGQGKRASHREPTHLVSSQVVETSHLEPSRGGGLGIEQPNHLGSARPFFNHLENQNTITTMCLREELTPYTTTDEAGLKDLIQKVKANAPDATWQELKHFIHEKAQVFQKTQVYNKFGFLLVAVPRCFEGQSFALWRESGGTEAKLRQKQQEEAASSRFMDIQHCRAVLINPKASEDEKQAAREILEAMGEGD